MTTTKKRKVIQLVIAGAGPGHEMGDSEWYLTALCDDGTMWSCDFTTTITWLRMPDVPDDE
jgi:hypothetical protein